MQQHQLADVRLVLDDEHAKLRGLAIGGRGVCHGHHETVYGRRPRRDAAATDLSPFFHPGPPGRHEPGVSIGTMKRSTLALMTLWSWRRSRWASSTRAGATTYRCSPPPPDTRCHRQLGHVDGHAPARHDAFRSARRSPALSRRCGRFQLDCAKGAGPRPPRPVDVHLGARSGAREPRRARSPTPAVSGSRRPRPTWR